MPRSGPTPKFVSFSFMMLYRGVSGFCACWHCSWLTPWMEQALPRPTGAASGVGAGFFFFLAATLCAFACACCAEDDVSSVNCAEDEVGTRPRSPRRPRMPLPTVCSGMRARTCRPPNAIPRCSYRAIEGGRVIRPAKAEQIFQNLVLVEPTKFRIRRSEADRRAKASHARLVVAKV